MNKWPHRPFYKNNFDRWDTWFPPSFLSSSILWQTHHWPFQDTARLCFLKCKVSDGSLYFSMTGHYIIPRHAVLKCTVFKRCRYTGRCPIKSRKWKVSTHNERDCLCTFTAGLLNLLYSTHSTDASKRMMCLICSYQFIPSQKHQCLAVMFL